MDIKLPQLGEGAESGDIVSIFVKEGDLVKKDQVILELESEKAVATIPSIVSGRVTKIHVKEGDKISVGQLIMSMTEEDISEKEPVKGKKESAITPIQSPDEEEETGIEKVEFEEPPVRQSGFPPAASPTLRKLAHQMGIDLNKVKGSERGGRIVMKDLKSYIQGLQLVASRSREISRKPGLSAARESIDFSRWGPVAIKPMSSIRRVISQRMHESWSAIPHVTQFDEADITGILDLRKKYLDQYREKGTHLTLTPFALKVLVEVLKKHPIFNSSLDEIKESIIYKDYYHIGIAVDTEVGLIVPVIRDVDKKDLLSLSKELEELAEKAKERKLSLDELQGSSFTISNQGGIGGGYFTPIVNQPNVAILGLGRGMPKPVVKNNKIDSRVMLPLGLSYDHRIIDGAQAARFITDLVDGFGEFDENRIKL